MAIKDLTKLETAGGLAVAVSDLLYIQSPLVSTIGRIIGYGVLAGIGGYFGKRILSEADTIATADKKA